jgi:hypothetical protein
MDCKGNPCQTSMAGGGSSIKTNYGTCRLCTNYEPGPLAPLTQSVLLEHLTPMVQTYFQDTNNNGTWAWHARKSGTGLAHQFIHT